MRPCRAPTTTRTPAPPTPRRAASASRRGRSRRRSRATPASPHRSQLVATWKGVRIVNDSKATNADAAEKALLSFERIRWIAGGRPKEGGIEALRPLFPRVAKAYLIGEAAEDFAATLGETPHVVSRHARRRRRRGARRGGGGRGRAARAGLRQLRPVRELRGARRAPSRRWSGRGSVADDLRAVYEAEAAGFDRDRNRSLIERELARPLPRARPRRARPILDLGCGAGEPIARYLIATRPPGDRRRLRGGHARDRPRPRFPAGGVARGRHAQARPRAALRRHRRLGQLLPPDPRRAARDRSRSSPATSLPGGALLFTSGPADGEAMGAVGGRPVHHASLSPAGLRRAAGGRAASPSGPSWPRTPPAPATRSGWRAGAV